MADYTTAQLQQFLTVLSSRAIPSLRSAIFMGQIIGRNFEPQISSEGDTVQVPIPPTLTVEEVGEGATYTDQAPTPDFAQVVLSKHKVVPFAVTDMARIINGGIDAVDLLLEPAMIAIAEAIETDIYNLYPNFASIGTAGVNPTEGLIDQAERTLFDNKVPSSSPLWLACASTPYSVLRQIARFSEVDAINSGTAIVTGRLGQLKGFNVLRSQLVPVTGSGPASTHNLAFAPGAMTLAMRRLPAPDPGTGAVAVYAEEDGYGMRIMTSYNHATMKQQWTVDVLYGVATVRAAFGLRVLT